MRMFFESSSLGTLTEGYGVSEHQAYPTLLQEKLNQELAKDRNATFKVINAGISGSTTSGGVSELIGCYNLPTF